MRHIPTLLLGILWVLILWLPIFPQADSSTFLDLALRAFLSPAQTLPFWQRIALVLPLGLSALLTLLHLTKPFSRSITRQDLIFVAIVTGCTYFLYYLMLRAGATILNLVDPSVDAVNPKVGPGDTPVYCLVVIAVYTLIYLTGKDDAEMI